METNPGCHCGDRCHSETSLKQSWNDSLKFCMCQQSFLSTTFFLLMFYFLLAFHVTFISQFFPLYHWFLTFKIGETTISSLEKSLGFWQRGLSWWMFRIWEFWPSSSWPRKSWCCLSSNQKIKTTFFCLLFSSDTLENSQPVSSFPWRKCMWASC